MLLQVHHYLVKLFQHYPVPKDLIVGFDDACHLKRFARLRTFHPKTKELLDNARLVGEHTPVRLLLPRLDALQRSPVPES